MLMGFDACVAPDEPFAAVRTDPTGDLPFACVVDGDAGTVPNDFTVSALMAGILAGEEEMGADDASSIDPKVTDEPCLTALALLRGTDTPSLIDTP